MKQLHGQASVQDDDTAGANTQQAQQVQLTRANHPMRSLLGGGIVAGHSQGAKGGVVGCVLGYGKRIALKPVEGRREGRARYSHCTCQPAANMSTGGNLQVGKCKHDNTRSWQLRDTRFLLGAGDRQPGMQQCRGRQGSEGKRRSPHSHRAGTGRPVKGHGDY